MKPEIKISKEDAQLIVDQIKADICIYDVEDIVGGKTETKDIQDMAVEKAEKALANWLLAGVMLGKIDYKKEDKKIVLYLQKPLKTEESEKKQVVFHVKDIDMNTMKSFESYHSEVDQMVAAMAFLVQDMSQKLLKKLSGNDLYFANAITKLFL